MVALYYTLNSTVNIYSMDHRGVGLLSSRLDCGVPQATMTLDQYAACINKLLPEMDNNPVAYSVTSAARDAEQLIAKLNQKEETFVYGASYGTYWLERLMHLAPTTVKGYVLDGVVPEAGVALNDWNKKLRPPGDLLFEYCSKSANCALKTTTADKLYDQVLQRFEALDKAPNTCVKHVNLKPSEFLRSVVFSGLRRVDHLEAFPYVLNLFFTCDPPSQQQIAKILQASTPPTPPETPREENPEVAFAIMLENLITYSEEYDYPMQSSQEMKRQYRNGALSRNCTDDALKACLFLKDEYKSDVCKAASKLPMSKSFVYERDEFFNKTARIPHGASVLFLQGKLDLNTPVHLEELEFHNMQGDAKLQVQFDHGRHRVAVMKDTQPCAVSIIGSFVTAHGDLTKVDSS